MRKNRLYHLGRLQEVLKNYIICHVMYMKTKLICNKLMLAYFVNGGVHTVYRLIKTLQNLFVNCVEIFSITCMVLLEKSIFVVGICRGAFVFVLTDESKTI